MTILAVDFGDAVATSAIAAFFTVLLGGLVTYLWTGATRRRQDQLAALSRFHDLYGEWCNVWQEWTHACESGRIDDAVANAFYGRASVVEGGFEAMLVTLATERRLTPAELRRLGQFRQGYQQLRKKIRDRVPLDWKVDPDLWAESQVDPYVVFKALSVEFAGLLGYGGRHLLHWGRPSVTTGQRAMIEITSWRSPEQLTVVA